MRKSQALPCLLIERAVLDHVGGDVGSDGDLVSERVEDLPSRDAPAHLVLHLVVPPSPTNVSAKQIAEFDADGSADRRRLAPCEAVNKDAILGVEHRERWRAILVRGAFRAPPARRPRLRTFEARDEFLGSHFGTALNKACAAARYAPARPSRKHFGQNKCSGLVALNGIRHDAHCLRRRGGILMMLFSIALKPRPRANVACQPRMLSRADARFPTCTANPTQAFALSARSHDRRECRSLLCGVDQTRVRCGSTRRNNGSARSCWQSAVVGRMI